MTCGEKITELRKKANMTQQQLGDELNVSAQAVSKWEHDQAEPDISTIKKICILFKISTDEFFDLEKEKPQEKELVDEKTNDEPAPVQVVAEPAPAPVKEFLGVCTNCGTAIDKTNLGIKDPRMYCKKCYANMLAEKELRRKQAIAHEKQVKREQYDLLRKKKNKSIRWGLCITIPIFVINLIVLISGAINGQFETTTTIAYSFISVFSLYSIYALVADYIIDDGIVGDILEFFICAPIKFPGIIFGFDLGGFIFLIVLKVLFAIIGFIIGVILFLVGIAIGSLVAAFVFPFHMANLNSEIKENII